MLNSQTHHHREWQSQVGNYQQMCQIYIISRGCSVINDDLVVTKLKVLLSSRFYKTKEADEDQKHLWTFSGKEEREMKQGIPLAMMTLASN